MPPPAERRHVSGSASQPASSTCLPPMSSLACRFDAILLVLKAAFNLGPNDHINSLSDPSVGKTRPEPKEAKRQKTDRSLKDNLKMVYGEVGLKALFDILIHIVKLNPCDRFADLGGGVGKPAFLAGLLGCRATSVEADEIRHNAAEIARKALATSDPDAASRLTLVHGNFTATVAEWSLATIILVTNVLFDTRELLCLLGQFSKMIQLRVVITCQPIRLCSRTDSAGISRADRTSRRDDATQEFLTNFSQYKVVRHDPSWSCKESELYVYTKKTGGDGGGKKMPAGACAVRSTHPVEGATLEWFIDDFKPCQPVPRAKGNGVWVANEKGQELCLMENVCSCLYIPPDCRHSSRVPETGTTLGMSVFLFSPEAPAAKAASTKKADSEPTAWRHGEEQKQKQMVRRSQIPGGSQREPKLGTIDAGFETDAAKVAEAINRDWNSLPTPGEFQGGKEKFCRKLGKRQVDALCASLPPFSRLLNAVLAKFFLLSELPTETCDLKIWFMRKTAGDGSGFDVHTDFPKDPRYQGGLVTVIGFDPAAIEESDEPMPTDVAPSGFVESANDAGKASTGQGSISVQTSSPDCSDKHSATIQPTASQDEPSVPPSAVVESPADSSEISTHHDPNGSPLGDTNFPPAGASLCSEGAGPAESSEDSREIYTHTHHDPDCPALGDTDDFLQSKGAGDALSHGTAVQADALQVPCMHFGYPPTFWESQADTSHVGLHHSDGLHASLGWAHLGWAQPLALRQQSGPASGFCAAALPVPAVDALERGVHSFEPQQPLSHLASCTLDHVLARALAEHWPRRVEATTNQLPCLICAQSTTFYCQECTSLHSTAGSKVCVPLCQKERVIHVWCASTNTYAPRLVACYWLYHSNVAYAASVGPSWRVFTPKDGISCPAAPDVLDALTRHHPVLFHGGKKPRCPRCRKETRYGCSGCRDPGSGKSTPMCTVQRCTTGASPGDAARTCFELMHCN